MKVFRNFNNTFSKLPPRTNWLFWLLIAFLCKATLFYYKTNVESRIIPNHYFPQTIGYEGGDTYSYIEPVEHLIANGTYDGPIFQDYRMPGYGAIYYFLRLFLSITPALNALVILQLIASSISVYVFGLIAFTLLKKESAFYLGFLLYAISIFVSITDVTLLSESFSASSLLFSVYFLLQSKRSFLNTLLAGLFLTWGIFLRPVLAPILIIGFLYLLIKDRRDLFQLKKYQWKTALTFLIPFLLIDGIWIARNYQKYDRLVPLTKSQYYPGVEESYWAGLIPFMNAFGGSLVFWEPGSELSFFLPTPEYVEKKVEAKIPDYAYTSQFNLDSLLIIKSKIVTVDSLSVENEKRKALINEINASLITYAQSIKAEKPFLYYFSSRIHLLKKFFVQSGTYNLYHQQSSQLSTFKYLIKVFYSLLYAIVIISGFIGILILLIKGLKNTDYLLISLIGLYIALIFPFFLMLCEYRYFVPGYPFFCLASVYLIAYSKELFQNKTTHA